MNIPPKLEQQIRQVLSTPKYWDEPKPEGSIMYFGDVCDHDNGFMCKHRLDRLLQIIKDYQNET